MHEDFLAPLFHISGPMTATPNHALQRTGSAVTAPAADHRRLPPTGRCRARGALKTVRLGADLADALLMDQRADGALARATWGWVPRRPSLLDELSA